jgi:hypothetical protein
MMLTFSHMQGKIIMSREIGALSFLPTNSRCFASCPDSLDKSLANARQRLFGLWESIYMFGKKISHGLSPAKKGALTELIVCADLISKGYDVFRAVSPACPCDLVAAKKNVLIRVEVRSVTKTPNNKIHPNFGHTDIGRSDIVCFYLDGEIMYFKTPAAKPYVWEKFEI